MTDGMWLPQPHHDFPATILVSNKTGWMGSLRTAVGAGSGLAHIELLCVPWWLFFFLWNINMSEVLLVLLVMRNGKD